MSATYLKHNSKYTHVYYESVLLDVISRHRHDKENYSFLQIFGIVSIHHTV